MKYLPTAFGQLAFAWKLYNYGLNGKIDADELDEDVAWQDGDIVFVVPRALGSAGDLLIALQNNLTIAFGAAAITLNRVREEIGIPLPDPIALEDEQCVGFIYQIRNAFAHDIAEPVWRINPRYRRLYEFGGMQFDLSHLDGIPFSYEHLGGPNKFFEIKDFFSKRFGAG
ncbi:hypothetical protein [Sphingomonas mali]|uniref:hypothetical protein n=1 Tax=Sphingomonas mali TaxID=40682 RepID=UPI0008349BFC|nr:hypothetical protein [Sphingomonas mali]